MLRTVLSMTLVAVAADAAPWRPEVPRTWDEGITTFDLPLADPKATPVHVAADYYYRIPVRKIYRSYPVYRLDREPPHYLEWLAEQEPELLPLDTSKLATREDWIAAGERVFDMPSHIDTSSELSAVRSQEWWDAIRPPVDRDGIFPYGQYVIREKGKVELASAGCINCHVRIVDGRAVRGTQGDFPLGQSIAYETAWSSRQPKYRGDPKAFRSAFLAMERMEFGVPWLRALDPVARESKWSIEKIVAAYRQMPLGTMPRTSGSVQAPIRTPDLFGVKFSRYFDATGLAQHRDTRDIMRYAALGQGMAYFSSYAGFVPGLGKQKQLPNPESLERYSDEQLYALALYVESLQPPANPNPVDALAKRGEKVFGEAGCAQCHSPPLYTNNALMRVASFTPPAGHRTGHLVMEAPVATDPELALHTRRGTGYYKVPTLKAIWLRTALGHDGSVQSVDDWMDPAHAMKGHPWGLDLPAADRRALVAFMKTL